MKLRWLLLGLLLVLLLVPAGLLTTARLLDLPGGTWVRLVAFTPYALPLYAVALLLLLLASWRGRGVWRGGARLLVVVCLVAVGLHALWAAPPFVGTPSAEAAGAHRLTVMTLNLRLGQAAPARVVELAVHDDVDLLVLEEVTPTALAGLEAAGISQALPHRAGRAASGASGTVVLARHPLRHERRLDTTLGSWSVDLAAPGGALHLVAAHPRPPVGDVAGWRADHGVLRHAVRARPGPVLVVGDLNATMDHVPLRTLVGIGLQDAATQADAGWQPTWPAAGEVSRLGVSVPSLVPIDHVLVGGGLRALSTRSVTVPGTDHRALLARVAW